MSKQTLYSADLESDFRTFFWIIYPRRVAIRAACAAYVKARLRGNDHTIIMEGLQKFLMDLAQRPRDMAFVPHASTWLNQDRFMDEYAPPPNSSESLLARAKAESQH